MDNPGIAFNYNFHFKKNGEFRGQNYFVHDFDVVMEIKEIEVKAKGRYRVSMEIKHLI